MDELLRIYEDRASISPHVLKAHRRFHELKPLSLYVGQYDEPDDTSGYEGQFPTFENLDSLDLQNYCSVEFPAPLLERIAARPDCPEWLKPDFGPEGPAFVAIALERSDYRAAWMALNSGRWDALGQLRTVRKFVEVVPDPGCRLQLELWLATAGSQPLAERLVIISAIPILFFAILRSWSRRSGLQGLLRWLSEKVWGKPKGA